MANRWGNNAKSNRLCFLGLQNHCSLEIKRCLLLGRKAMASIDSILKSTDITSLIKVHLANAMVFPVVMYGCDGWTIKKAECLRIGAFELWCWRSLLRIRWTSRSSSQSALREIIIEYSLEGLTLKLKVQYLDYLMWKPDSLEKTLRLGKIEGRRRREWQRMRWLDGIIDQWTWVCSSPRIWWWTGQPGVLQFMGLQTFGQDCATELKWTEYSIVYMYQDFFIHSCVDE